MALPRLFPGSISTLAPHERISAGARVNRKIRRELTESFGTLSFNRDLLVLVRNGWLTLKNRHGLPAADLVVCGCLWRTLFYGWIVYGITSKYEYFFADGSA